MWFDTEAERAAEFYVSLFANSSVDEVNRRADGSVFVVDSPSTAADIRR